MGAHLVQLLSVRLVGIEKFLIVASITELPEFIARMTQDANSVPKRSKKSKKEVTLTKIILVSLLCSAMLGLIASQAAQWSIYIMAKTKAAQTKADVEATLTGIYLQIGSLRTDLTALQEKVANLTKTAETESNGDVLTVE